MLGVLPLPGFCGFGMVPGGVFSSSFAARRGSATMVGHANPPDFSPVWRLVYSAETAAWLGGW